MLKLWKNHTFFSVKAAIIFLRNRLKIDINPKGFSIFVEHKKIKQMAKVMDYTPNVFTHYYFQDGAKYCFTVYPGFFVMNKEVKGLDLSDYDFVVGIGPQGSYSFQ